MGMTWTGSGIAAVVTCLAATASTRGREHSDAGWSWSWNHGVVADAVIPPKAQMSGGVSSRVHGFCRVIWFLSVPQLALLVACLLATGMEALVRWCVARQNNQDIDADSTNATHLLAVVWCWIFATIMFYRLRGGPSRILYDESEKLSLIGGPSSDELQQTFTPTLDTGDHPAIASRSYSSTRSSRGCSRSRDMDETQDNSDSDEESRCSSHSSSSSSDSSNRSGYSSDGYRADESVNELDESFVATKSKAASFIESFLEECMSLCLKSSCSNQIMESTMTISHQQKTSATAYGSMKRGPFVSQNETTVALSQTSTMGTLSEDDAFVRDEQQVVRVPNFCRQVMKENKELLFFWNRYLLVWIPLLLGEICNGADISAGALLVHSILIMCPSMKKQATSSSSTTSNDGMVECHSIMACFRRITMHVTMYILGAVLSAYYCVER
jgi:hypothetical protein